MHRSVLNPGLGKQVDHINRNKLDNRFANLRICSPSQNNWNCGVKRKNNTSGFKGVSKYKKKWVATIQANREHIHIGYFKNKVKAAKAYNQAALKYHGEFAGLNFL